MNNIFTLILALLFITSLTKGQMGWYPQISPGNTYLSIFFLDNNNGWCINWNSQIIHTTDGGNTWAEICHVDTLGIVFFDIKFFNLMNGWAACSDGYTPFYTTDGGFSWKKSNYLDSIPLGLTKIYFIDSLRGWAAGCGGWGTNYQHISGGIAFTSDGGKNWSIEDTTEEQLLGLKFIDSFNGWAVGCNGIILHTSNGGINWLRQDSLLTSVLLKNVFFTDSLNGWAVGDSGIIINTSNGGSNWSRQNSRVDTLLTDLYFTNSLKGWVIGCKGIILFTSDGGSNWILENSGVSFNLTSICFVDSTTGWVCGLYDTILHTTTGGLTFVGSERNNAYSNTNLIISPNPASDFIEINVGVQNFEPLQNDIRIYNVFGEIVFVEHKGNSSDDWQTSDESRKIDVSSFPPGLYFVQVGGKVSKFVKI